MKAAMHSIAGNIMRKEKVPENTSTVLCMTEEEQPVMAEPEQVYWDGNRWTGPARRPNPPTYVLDVPGRTATSTVASTTTEAE